MPSWWTHAAETDRLPSSSAFVALYAEGVRAVVVRNGCLPVEYRGWAGKLAAASTREILTFYPGHEKATAFSRQKNHNDHAAIKPSVAFYEWLRAMAGPAWQLRGTLHLDESDLTKIVGERFEDVRVESVSLWGGAEGSRTPFHVDNVHAMIFQVAGTKRFFLCPQDDVAKAVDDGRLPRRVLEEGATESLQIHGPQAAIYGLHDAAPQLVIGQLARLNEGDCLLLPAGIYHDVESVDHALSLTIRFDLDADHSDVRKQNAQANIAMSGPGADVTLQRLFWRLAIKKAAQQLAD